VTTHNDDETVMMKNEGHFEHNEPMIELDLESLVDESQAEFIIQILESQTQGAQGASQSDIFIVPSQHIQRGRNKTSAPKNDNIMLTQFKRGEEFGQYSSLNRDQIRQQSQSMHADKIKMLFAQQDL
jgi:hypothetical protein